MVTLLFGSLFKPFYVGYNNLKPWKQIWKA